MKGKEKHEKHSKNLLSINDNRNDSNLATNYSVCASASVK